MELVTGQLLVEEMVQFDHHRLAGDVVLIVWRRGGCAAARGVAEEDAVEDLDQPVVNCQEVIVCC